MSVTEAPLRMPDVIERDPPTDRQRDTSDATGNTFGKCPACGKPLRPRCKHTGEPKAPPVNAGYESRAKCSGCGTIIVYIGNYEWRVATSAELNDPSQFDPVDKLLSQ